MTSSGRPMKIISTPMYASWRTFRLCAPKALHSCTRAEKKSRSDTSSKFLLKNRRNFQETRLLNMSLTKSLKDLVLKEVKEGATVIPRLLQLPSALLVTALREPIEQWTSIKGKHNALELLYQDPKRWSFSFNMYAQLTRVQMHMKEHIKPIKLLERSLFSTRYCFVENDYRNNIINGMEYTILTNWFDWLVKSQKADMDLIVYVRADPEVCYERIKKRSRKEEALVPFSLIKDLHHLHEEWLIEQKHFKSPAQVFVLDANREYSEMKQLYETHRRDILCGCV